MNEARGLSIQITGVVQGVGFRPFVYATACNLALRGWVRNTNSGVEIAVDGSAAALERFVVRLKGDVPPLARIDQLQVAEIEVNGFEAFEIVASSETGQGFQPVSPDVSICPDCLAELFDPTDRRFRYPFINCTNCGPRYTIISDMPYDRPATTMADFMMCADCASEYSDPGDRRFHAQPVACPVCGPQIWFEPDGQRGEQALQATRRLLRDGKIVAIKGLGGFHLACDAHDSKVVQRLRAYKQRADKPFAVMMPDVEAVRRHCWVSEAERSLLESRERPIVILRHRPDSSVAEAVAPQQATLGVMLPYTPLHALLLERQLDIPEALVMTSGNPSDEPLVMSNQAAQSRLSPLADAFLLHDRQIEIRCDDTVASVYQRPDEAASIYPLRRARGYAPFPIRLPWEMPPMLGAGAELKNAFCLTREHHAFLSQHIGDLENYETLRSYETGIAHLERLFRIKPEVLVHDLHPDYLATRYVLDRAASEGLATLGVQHHHAHLSACIAEHAYPADRPIIGVIFDGTGYGTDGTIWGGEFLLGSYSGFERTHWLKPIPLPGGDTAVRHPWRQALAWLHTAGIHWEERMLCVQAASDRALDALEQQIEHGINAPLTSSIGRLFDAIASLAGVRQSVSYEAQAAIELEALVDGQEEGVYHFTLKDPVIDAAPVIAGLLRDYTANCAVGTLAARFHNGLAVMVRDVCQSIRRQHGIDVVALSGGVWQNTTLLDRAIPLLESAGFKVFIHRQVPANDGGLALGQVAVAHHSLR
jgi:hydrogenase maturation protein HypF